jgi:catechol 2,3-dioxygenase-like lactoylglutathione lyase family enzyme
MKLRVLCVAILVLCSSAKAQEPVRPHISSIAGVKIWVTDLAAAQSFYSKALDKAHNCNWCEQAPGRSFLLGHLQVLTLQQAPSPAPQDLLAQIAFATDDIPKLRRYLVSRNLTVSKPDKDADTSLRVDDPEGHHIEFVARRKLNAEALARIQSQIPNEPYIIHAGLVVNDQAKMDHFYRDILGFRPYWHGGMKDGKDDWVALQVPDGTDWIEYMLNISPNADHHTLGVMNHIALGVTDIQATNAALLSDGWKPGEEPKLGRDGKWQLNVYDPDDTRIEFMEFTPKEKPCCSEFTGPHPKP